MEQARHGGRAREPENEDGRDIVNASEGVAQILMRQVGDGAPTGRSALLVGALGNQKRSHETGYDQQHAHDQGRGGQQFARVADSATRAHLRILVFSFASTNERHHGDSGLESAQPQRELRENQQRRDQQPRPIVVLAEQSRLPILEKGGVMQTSEQYPNQHNRVQQQVRYTDRSGQLNRLGEAFQEYQCVQSQQAQSDLQMRIAQEVVQIRIMGGVRGRIGGRKRHGDNESLCPQSQATPAPGSCPPSRAADSRASRSNLGPRRTGWRPDSKSVSDAWYGGGHPGSPRPATSFAIVPLSRRFASAVVGI